MREVTLGNRELWLFQWLLALFFIWSIWSPLDTLCRRLVDITAGLNSTSLLELANFRRELQTQKAIKVIPCTIYVGGIAKSIAPATESGRPSVDELLPSHFLA